MTSEGQPTFDFSGDGAAGATSNNANTPYTPSAVPGQDIPAQQRDSGGYKGVHPIAAGFHVAFKIGAVLTYFLAGLFAGYIVTFVITILFCAVDFWVTKNITGRILVALRWWNEVKDDGTTQWVFESAPEGDNRVNAYDNWFFWITCAGYCAFWLLMCIFNLFSLNKLPIAIVGFLLAGANLLGYVKCRRDAKTKLTEFVIAQATSRPAAVTAVASAATSARGANITPSM